MRVITTKQLIGLFLVFLIGLGLYVPDSFFRSVSNLHTFAICLAAFLPVGCFQIARSNFQLTIPLILLFSIFLGLLWYVIIQPIYPPSAIALGIEVSLGSYLMLRMK